MLADLRICVPGGCAEWCLAPLVGGSEHVGVARCLAPIAVNRARHAQTRRALVLHRGEPGTYPRSSQAPISARSLPELFLVTVVRDDDATGRCRHDGILRSGVRPAVAFVEPSGATVA